MATSFKVNEALFIQSVATYMKGSRRKAIPASPPFLDWLATHSIPKPLIRLFTQCPLSKAVSQYTDLHPEKMVMRINDDFPAALAAGLLMIGSAPNGDVITIDFKKGKGATGYLSHEEMWDKADLKSIFIPVAPSIGKFLHELLANDGFPYDYWDAKKMLQRAKRSKAVKIKASS